jgi:hypothetical protein
MLESAFVIVRQYVRGPDPGGTGFFVSATGHFLTAAHIFEYDPGVPYSLALPPFDLTRLTPLPRTEVIPGKDMAAGRIIPVPKSHYPLAAQLPDIGAMLYAVGWDASHRGPALRLKVVKCEYVADYDFAEAAQQRASAKRFRAVITHPALPPGFGPILDSDGNVIALHSGSDPKLTTPGRSGELAVNVSLQGLQLK